MKGKSETKPGARGKGILCPQLLKVSLHIGDGAHAERVYELKI